MQKFAAFTLLICLLLSGMTSVTRANVVEEFSLITDDANPVTFKVVTGRKVMSCVGKFANTDGDFDGPFNSSVHVKFGPAAAGKSSLCVITLTLQGKNDDPPETRVLAYHVILPKIATHTLAHIAGISDEERTTLGVGEEVMYTVQPRDALMDADVNWRASNSWDRLSNRSGLATVYQSGFPPPGARKRLKIPDQGFGGGVTAFFPVTTNEITWELDNHPRQQKHRRPADKRSGRLYDKFLREHSVEALTAAYKTKLDALEVLLAHPQTFEPKLVTNEKPARFYLNSDGFDSALRTVASMRTRSPWDEEQPAELRTREVRLVARAVAVCRRFVDRAMLDVEPAPSVWDVQPPEGYKLNRSIVVGMIRPEDILQPDLRRQYEEAITANNKKIADYNKQVEADKDEGIMRRFALRYIRELCGKSDPDLHEFRQALLDSGLDERAMKEIVKEED